MRNQKFKHKDYIFIFSSASDISNFCVMEMFIKSNMLTLFVRKSQVIVRS